MLSVYLADAAGDPLLSATAVRVLVALHRELRLPVPGAECRPVKVAALARISGTTPSTCAKAVRQLVQVGYLREGPRDGALRTYMLGSPVWSLRTDWWAERRAGVEE